MHKHTCKHQEIAVRYRKLLLLAVISSEKYRKHTTDRVCTTFKKVMKFLKVLFVLCLCELFHKFLLHYLVRLIDTFTTNIVHFHNKHCSTSVMVSCFEVSWLMCKQLWKKIYFCILLYKIRTPKHVTLQYCESKKQSLFRTFRLLECVFILFWIITENGIPINLAYWNLTTWNWLFSVSDAVFVLIFEDVLFCKAPETMTGQRWYIKRQCQYPPFLINLKLKIQKPLN